MILKYLARLALKLAGWKIVGSVPQSKAVVIMAPHTANIDFVIGWLGFTSMGVRSHFLIKKELFKWYSGGLLRAMGGIPVDRKRSANVVLQVADEFHKHDNFIVTITPEGTRKLNHNWKKGFYFIALTAKVPVKMGYLDYKNKEGGFGPSFIPSGDFESDFKLVTNFYSTKQARHPEKFSLTPKP